MVENWDFGIRGVSLSALKGLGFSIELQQMEINISSDTNVAWNLVCLVVDSLVLLCFPGWWNCKLRVQLVYHR
jgi:hypothetical protein